MAPEPASGAGALVQARDLVKRFPVKRGFPIKRLVAQVHAVDGVSFDIAAGETLGLVGESGSGKSTIARMLAGLETPTDGTVHFDGQDLHAAKGERWRALRREIQMIFQDPYGSLNPRMTVARIVAEPWEIHPGVVPKNQRRARARELLDRVGINPDWSDRYPSQFSGGQQQRVGIARALALQPRLLVCDEPVSALDVSVQAQVMNLLRELQREYHLAYLFIGHDLSVVRAISDRVAVLYLGRVMELGSEQDVYERAAHPYTQALLSSAPSLHRTAEEREGRLVLPGEIPSPADPPSGCRFRTRCWKAEERCAQEVPELIDRFGHGHPSACHYAELRASAPS